MTSFGGKDFDLFNFYVWYFNLTYTPHLQEEKIKTLVHMAHTVL